MTVDDSFWDSFDLLPLTPEARESKKGWEEAAAAFDAAWDRVTLAREVED